MDERLKRQLDFALEIDKEKNIFRQTHLSGHGRNENDAEHAWHMAVMAYLLREYANEEVDIAKVMLMCLIHDIVEIDAGDTYAYDAEGLKTQKAREEAAKERIFSLLPPDQMGLPFPEQAEKVPPLPRHHQGPNLPGFQIEHHISHIAKPCSVCDGDDLFIPQFFQIAFHAQSLLCQSLCLSLVVLSLTQPLQNF